MVTTYLLDIRQLNKDAVFEAWLSRMPAERQEKVRRARHRMDQNRSLGAGILLARGLLACGIRQEDACIRTGRYGKPYLAEIRTKTGNLCDLNVSFSLSHSGNYVAAAFGSAPVGIDLEQERRNTGQLVRRVLTEEEQERYAACKSEAERSALFLRYWTGKESAAKVSGLGMQIDFRAINRVDCRIQVKWKDNLWKYFLWEFEFCGKADIMEASEEGQEVQERKERYHIAVCSEAEAFAPEPVWVDIEDEEV